MSPKPKPTSEAAPPLERPLTDFHLLLTVFVCGAALMAFEIIATRFLAPFFGNSVYVWGAVISLFLAAMTIGYALGGRISERVPASTSLPFILIGAGAFILLAPAVYTPICRSLEPFGARLGTLLASLILFSPAGLLIAMISPIAVHASVEEVSKVGSTAGRIYAVSAVGSIVGTLGASFFLIPLMGVAAIAVFLASALFFCALLIRFSSGGAGALAPSILSIAAFSGIVLLVHQSIAAPSTARQVFFAETPYHNVSVVDSARDRRLLFDDFVESSIELEPPYWSSSRYTDVFHLASFFAPEMKSVAFIGAGGGIGPREFKMFYPTLERIDVVDIDPVVLDVCRDYFFLEEDEVTRFHAVDGRQFVRHTPEPWDVVVLDAFTIGGQIPFHLATLEYFEEIAERLTPGGVFIMNTNSALEGPLAKVFQALYDTIDKVWPHVWVYAHGYAFGVDDAQTRNVIFIAAGGDDPPSLDLLLEKAAEFDRTFAEGRKNLFGVVRDILPDAVLDGLDRGPTLTDRFNPIDTFAFKGVLPRGL